MSVELGGGKISEGANAVSGAGLTAESGERRISQVR